eukprot:511948-Rhodomonas_salina.3
MAISDLAYGMILGHLSASPLGTPVHPFLLSANSTATFKFCTSENLSLTPGTLPWGVSRFTIVAPYEPWY